MKPILFVCRSPLDFFVIKDIYKHMADKSEIGIVSLFDSMFWASKKKLMLEYISGIVRSFGIIPVIIDPLSWEFLKDYKVAIYNSGIDRIDPCKLVRVPYSYAKSQAVLGPTNMLYDLICAPGLHWAKAMEQYLDVKTIITGSPKFDDWFSGNVSGNEIWQNIIVRDPNKKSILYAPTWGEVSTCHMCQEQIIEVSKHYNLIVKCHDGTYWQEPERWERFKEKNILVVNGDVDIQQIYKIVDFVIHDNSGGIFEANLVGKPIILVDRPYKDGIGTVSWSSEQINRDIGIRVNVDDPPSVFLKAIKTYEDFPDTNMIARERVRDEFYSFNDGKCGERCAESIMDLL